MNTLHQTMKEVSTPFDVTSVFNFEVMDIRTVRMTRLRLFADMKKVDGPVELGKLIGKKTNQVSDLFHGRAKFGEKVARSIERFADLPDGWLDIEEAIGLWPLSPDLFPAVANLPKDGRDRLESVMRAHLGVKAPAVATEDEVPTVEVPAADLPASQPTQGLHLAASDTLPLTPTKTKRLDEKIIKKSSKKSTRKV